MKFTAALLAFAAGTLAGETSIECQTVNQSGGRGNLPSHNFAYSFDGNNYFICGGLIESCGLMTGDESWKNTYSTCTGTNGGSEEAAFWITSDGCYNICSGGNHMYCCGAGNSNSGGRCIANGFSAGC
ncbi:hypothetical protein BJX63DRAFT_391665 [Aspergillus granulosus]|uniref:Cyanovirin-N domain-containing protein n=1 Tax=Aspergillus granulosus TaxID=176169 RepID=A0ABR4HH57_9EURO